MRCCDVVPVRSKFPYTRRFNAARSRLPLQRIILQNQMGRLLEACYQPNKSGAARAPGEFFVTPLIDYHVALARLTGELTSIAEQEDVPLAQACGRILARGVTARYDTPNADNSAMDGYAVADPQQNLSRYDLVGRVAAGQAAEMELLPGQAVRLFTGALVPRGASAVVPQEQTTLLDGRLMLAAPAPRGQFIRCRGEEYAAGAELLGAGRKIGPAALALAASQGYARLPVCRRLKVAVFSSGNELCEPAETLERGMIHDANRYQLLGWLGTLPVEVIDGGILPDNAAATRERLASMAKQVDVILTSGGTSVGEEDHLTPALAALGRLDAWRLAIKPGKPFAWGQLTDAWVFMLPGNPVATFVTFHLLVAPALRRLQGVTDCAPLAWRARADFARPALEPRREFLRGNLLLDQAGEVRVRIQTGQGSAMLSACVAANALVEVPPGSAVSVGDWLTVYPLP